MQEARGRSREDLASALAGRGLIGGTGLESGAVSAGEQRIQQDYERAEGMGTQNLLDALAGYEGQYTENMLNLAREQRQMESDAAARIMSTYGPTWKYAQRPVDGDDPGTGEHPGDLGPDHLRRRGQGRDPGGVRGGAAGSGSSRALRVPARTAGRTCPGRRSEQLASNLEYVGGQWNPVGTYTGPPPGGAVRPLLPSAGSPYSAAQWQQLAPAKRGGFADRASYLRWWNRTVEPKLKKKAAGQTVTPNPHGGPPQATAAVDNAALNPPTPKDPRELAIERAIQERERYSLGQAEAAGKIMAALASVQGGEPGQIRDAYQGAADRTVGYAQNMTGALGEQAGSAAQEAAAAIAAAGAPGTGITSESAAINNTLNYTGGYIPGTNLAAEAANQMTNALTQNKAAAAAAGRAWDAAAARRGEGDRGASLQGDRVAGDDRGREGEGRPGRARRWRSRSARSWCRWGSCSWRTRRTLLSRPRR